MDTSPRLGLSYIAPQQAQKHVTFNETVNRLDALAQLSALSDTVSVEPDDPQDGDIYILPEGASGAGWAGLASGLIVARQDGAWQQIAPGEGWRGWVRDAQVLLVFENGGWRPVASETGGGETEPVAVESLPLLGIYTTADTYNRFSVKSEAVLISHDDITPGWGGTRLTLNKKDPGNSSVLVFQTGFAGRAEFGLAGNDDVTLKVSPDGNSWRDGLVVDNVGGTVRLGSHLGVSRFLPSDFWSPEGEHSGVFLPYGNIGTNGSFGLGLWWNGYRNTSGAWSSQGLNGSAVGAGIELQEGGCFIRYQNGVPNEAPTIRVAVTDAYMAPGSDNALSCGTPSRRWSEIYAANGVINTSDARDKDIEGPLDEAEKRVAGRLLKEITLYRWKEARREKGDLARRHVG